MTNINDNNKPIEKNDGTENLDRLMSQLVEEGADCIIANPADIEKLIEKGIKFDKIPQRTLEESINRLIEQRKKCALKIAKQLPIPPNSADPAIRSLYNEIRECIIFGLYGAAITLSGILVEFILKYTTIVKEAGGYKYDAKIADEFEKLTLGPSIERANAAGLITTEEKITLENFKNEVRNPYNHYNIKKITGHVKWEKVKILDFDTQKVEEKDIYAKDDPVIQAQAKPFVDASRVLSVFTFADNIVKLLLEKINKSPGK